MSLSNTFTTEKYILYNDVYYNPDYKTCIRLLTQVADKTYDEMTRDEVAEEWYSWFGGYYDNLDEIEPNMTKQKMADELVEDWLRYRCDDSLSELYVLVGDALDDGHIQPKQLEFHILENGEDYQ